MAGRVGTTRTEKLLVHGLLNFRAHSEEIYLKALSRLPAEAASVREAVAARLAEAAEEEAEEAALEGEDAVPPLAATGSADEPAAGALAVEPCADEGLESASDADSNVGEADDDAIVDIAEADALERVEPAKPLADKEAPDEQELEAEEEEAADAADDGGESSEDAPDDVADEMLPVGVAIAEAAPAEEDGVASEEDIPRAEPLIIRRRRLRGKQAAPWVSDAETEEPLPKRRRLRCKQAPTGAWLAVSAEPRPPGPARAWLRPSKLCPGCSEKPCQFSTTRFGEAAIIHPGRGQTHCPLCSDHQLDIVLAQQAGAPLTKILAALRSLSEEQFVLALANLASRRGEEFAEDFRARVVRTEKRAAARRAPKLSVQEQWQAAIASRKFIGRLRKKELKEHNRQVLRDRASSRRKIFFPEEMKNHASAANEEDEIGRMPEPPADVLENDSCLPSASRSERATRAEQWCKHGSWQICCSCHSLRPRPFRPGDLKRVAKPAVKACGLCKRKEKVPQPEDIPEALQGLPREVVEALRPLEVDSGAFERAPLGYRVHTTMIRFAWADQDVEHKIAALDKKRHRKIAKKAFEYLTADVNNSSYAEFIDRHREFQEQHPAAEEKTRKRPLRFIEEKGLECALWPHLYWDSNLCETFVRATDERRQAARRTGLSDDSDNSSAEESDDGEEGIELKKGRHSIRRSFMKKVLGPIIGYSQDYQLLHFVYDLSMWSSLGGCKNATAGRIPLRLALKAAPFSPEYWKVRHLALIDMQRQCGLPNLFRTRAPFETTFPYHQWVLDEMMKSGKGRRQLGGPETLHMAHVLSEFDRGLFSGMNTRDHSRADRRWTEHILGASDGSNRNTVVNFCSRLEFQDGKRKRGTQKYHGSGRVHSHSLDFLENLDAVQLHTKLAATIPEAATDPMLRGIVLDSQQDWTRSGVPLREEPSAWDAEAGKALLHHSEDDHDAHIRAYFPETMEVTKCHEDVQQGEGTSALLRYVATYQQKFSSSFAKEWLNDEASDYSLARRILFDHHPLEPEMWLTLFAQKFPQCVMGGTMVDMVAPIPGSDTKTEIVESYEKCTWRRSRHVLA